MTQQQIKLLSSVRIHLQKGEKCDTLRIVRSVGACNRDILLIDRRQRSDW